MTLSHHIMIDKVLDHPDGKVSLRLRDRTIVLSVSEARYLASALLEHANAIEPPPEPPVEVSEAPAE